MADANKVLGQLAAAATTPEILYATGLAQAVCSSLVVCNRTAGPLTFRVSVRVNGADADDKQYLYYDKEIAANDTIGAVLGLTLNKGDAVYVYASALGLTFSLFGVESR